MKKATIYDVAREAGVSLATVSRVINGSSVVREKTKEKVMKVIDELNFKPNQIARGLATNKTTTIAIIFPQSLFAHVKDMIGGIGDTGRHLDYNINMYTTDDIGDENTVADITERLVKSRVDGAILFNNENIEEMVQWTTLWKKSFAQEPMELYYLITIILINKLNLLKNIVFRQLLLECK